MNEDFVNVWTEIAQSVSEGGKLSISDLLAIYDNLQLEKFSPEYLPNKDTILGSVENRKKAIFKFSELIWAYTPADWLKMEKEWLDESRILYPSKTKKGKERNNDVISAEILLRIVAAAKLVKEEHDPIVVNETVFALNLILMEACAKGRTRLKKNKGKTVNSILRAGGLMVGSGGSKYLPLPEKSMPILLLMLHRDYVRPEVYTS